MKGIFEELKQNFTRGSALIKMIYVNAAIFIAYSLIFLVLFFMKATAFAATIGQWFAVPALLPNLALKPWTVISYMFYHEDPFHILFNMLCLYWFGKIFLTYFDTKKFTAIYFLGGIAGAVFYILAFNLVTVFHPDLETAAMIGASASVMAIIFSVSLYHPNYKVNLMFFGEVKLIYVALISIVIDLLMIPRGNAGGHIAHLGGAFFGYIWALQYKRGRDISSFFSNILQFIQSLFRRRNRLKVSHKKPVNDLDYNKRKLDLQKETDRILDKISKGGYQSLTKEEKETLFQMGNKN